MFGASEKSSTFATAIERDAPDKGFASGNSSVGRAQPCQGWGRGSESRFPLNLMNKKEFRRGSNLLLRAQVAELVDAHVSGACAARRAGSSPVLGTLFYSSCIYVGEVAELVDALL